jgi:hypothetical protein
MNALTRDPLLSVSRAILWVLTIVLAVAVGACAIAIPALIFTQGSTATSFARAFPGCDPWKVIVAIVAVLALAILLLLLVISCLRLLRQIVDTVGEGDPFIPVNAQRLTTMAWLVLAIQVVLVPMEAIGVWIAQFDPKEHVHIDAGISGNGLLLMLVLFVLARVFRQGTAMREELEGTI